MSFNLFIGIDVSKEWLGFSVMRGNQLLYYAQVSNNIVGIQLFIKQLKKEKDFDFQTAPFLHGTHGDLQQSFD